MVREDGKVLEDAAAALYAGEIDGGRFLALTRGHWRRSAAHLHVHWRRKLPAWVEREDVEQVLAFLAMTMVRGGRGLHGEAVSGWRPGGMPIGRYVAWAATRRAQREIHRWRGASLHGKDQSNPSRAEVAFTRAYAPGVDPLARFEGEPTTEDFDVRQDMLSLAKLLERCETGAEAVAVQALWAAGGSVSEAAAAIAADYDARVEAGVSSAAQAERLVARTVARLAGAPPEEVASPVRAPASAPEGMFEDDEVAEDAAERAA